MTGVYFGARWDAPIVDEACSVCGEPIEAGDRGLIRACVRMADGGWTYATSEPVHLECDLLGVLGHQFGICSCRGYGHTRADARLVLDRLNAGRIAQGMGPL